MTPVALSPFYKLSHFDHGQGFFACPHPFGPKNVVVSRSDGSKMPKMWTVFVDKESVLRTEDGQEALDLINGMIDTWRANPK